MVCGQRIFGLGDTSEIAIFIFFAYSLGPHKHFGAYFTPIGPKISSGDLFRLWFILFGNGVFLALKVRNPLQKSI